MIDFDFKIESDLEEWYGQSIELMKRIMEEAGEVIEEEVAGEAPVLTGALRDSIEVDYMNVGFNLSSDVIYANVQDERYGYVMAGFQKSLSRIEGVPGAILS